MGRDTRKFPHMLPSMANRLRELRLERNLTHEQAAEAMGVSKGQFIKLERGERRLTHEYMQMAARAFSVSPAHIIASADAEPMVPLMGFVGAAQAVYQFDEDGAGEVEAPPGANESTVAVEVRGESMWPVYEDGTLLYYSRQLDPADMVGKRCIVRLADDRVLVKSLRKGSERGLWTLVSLNAPDIEDVVVLWAAPIDWIKPR